jgi:5-guanidino-2-oxopentanoate decarboxylase
MAPNERTIGRYVVDTLKANGVTRVFGIPGVHTLDLYRGLPGSGLPHVLPRHEQGAAFAADGHARMTGRPAACFLISGPGVGNAMTAIGQAYSDSVPMLVIAAAPASATLGKGHGALHEMKDQRAMAETVTAFAVTARSAEDIRDALARAFALFAGGRPRPVYIEVPRDLLSGTTDLEPETFAPADLRPRPDPEAAAEASRLLHRAARPLVILGGGAVAAGAAAGRAALDIAERLDGYVVTTVAAKGLVPSGHPACLGSTLPWEATRDLAAEADVVLVAGSELAETDHWTDRLHLPGAIIRVDLDVAKLGDGYRAALSIMADAGAALQAIAAALAEFEPGRREAGWRRSRGAGPDIVAARMPLLPERARLHARVLAAIRAGLPADGVVFSDMTQIAYTGNVVFPVDRPRSWFHPCGFGTLGYALPAAIGGKLAEEDRPVVALAGDYGFQFTLQELGTAAEAGITLPILVWNNDRLAQIRDDMVASGIPEVGVSQVNPDFALLAAAYGIPAVRPARLEEVTTALAEALTRPGPTLIEIRQDVMAADR